MAAPPISRPPSRRSLRARKHARLVELQAPAPRIIAGFASNLANEVVAFAQGMYVARNRTSVLARPTGFKRVDAMNIRIPIEGGADERCRAANAPDPADCRLLVDGRCELGVARTCVRLVRPANELILRTEYGELHSFNDPGSDGIEFGDRGKGDSFDCSRSICGTGWNDGSEHGNGTWDLRPTCRRIVEGG